MTIYLEDSGIVNESEGSKDIIHGTNSEVDRDGIVQNDQGGDSNVLGVTLIGLICAVSIIIAVIITWKCLKAY